MVLWNSDSVGFAVSPMVLVFTLTVSTVQALYGHVDIVNAFRSPTQFTCHSDRVSRQAYTASTGEIYDFAFNTDLHEYWDCQVSNQARRLSETLRFWGDDSHGGPKFWGCYNCFWSTQEVGVYLYHDGMWRYWCSWSYNAT